MKFRLIVDFPSGTILEIGGGENPAFPLNLDLRPIKGKVKVVGAAESLPFRDDTFSGVFGRYVLEHVGWRKVRQAVSEIFRVLRPFGSVVLFLPNTEEQCKVVAERRFGKDWDHYAQMLFGDQKYGEEAHKSFWCPEMAEEVFKAAGFKQVLVYPHPDTPTDMVVEAVKLP